MCCANIEFIPYYAGFFLNCMKSPSWVLLLGIGGVLWALGKAPCWVDFQKKKLIRIFINATRIEKSHLSHLSLGWDCEKCINIYSKFIFL